MTTYRKTKVKGGIVERIIHMKDGVVYKVKRTIKRRAKFKSGIGG